MTYRCRQPVVPPLMYKYSIPWLNKCILMVKTAWILKVNKLRLKWLLNVEMRS